MSSGTSGGKPGAAGAPNFVGAANAQSAGQQALLNQQTWANRPNVNTPWGSYAWTPPPGTGPDYAPSGAAAPGGSGGPGGASGDGGEGIISQLQNPSGFGGQPGSSATGAGGAGGPEGQWQLDVNLSPEQQALFQQQQALQGGTNQAALDRLGSGISGQGVEDALYGRLTSRLDPQWNQREDQQTSRLYNMGLREGDSAFDQSMQNFGRDRNDAYSQAGYQSILGGDQSASNQVNIINALRGGNSVSMPGQPNVAQAGVAQAPDLIGAMNASNAYNAQNSPIALAGQLAPYAFMLSDERLKTNIRRLDAEALPGVPWATWEWKAGGHGKGVIAQDVLSAGREDLVLLGEDGFFRVDYSRIGG